MQNVQISIPDDLVQSLKNLTTDVNSFVVQAIQKSVQELQRKKLEAELIEGYKARFEETKQLVQEFEHIDLSNWDDY